MPAYKIHVPSLLEKWEECYGSEGPSATVLANNHIDSDLIDMMRAKGGFTYAVTANGAPANPETSAVQQDFIEFGQKEGYSPRYTSCALQSPVHMAELLEVDMAELLGTDPHNVPLPEFCK